VDLPRVRRGLDRGDRALRGQDLLLRLPQRVHLGWREASRSRAAGPCYVTVTVTVIVNVFVETLP